MRALLDTGVAAAHIPPLDGGLAISAITPAEVHFGVLIARTQSVRAERLRRLSLLERPFGPLPLDQSVAASYGRIVAAVVSAGRNPRGPVMKLLIAATAHTHGARPYTRYPDDFRGLGDLIDVVAL